MTRCGPVVPAVFAGVGCAVVGLPTDLTDRLIPVAEPPVGVSVRSPTFAGVRLLSVFAVPAVGGPLVGEAAELLVTR